MARWRNTILSGALLLNLALGSLALAQPAVEEGEAILLSKTVVGDPVTAGAYVFWLDNRRPETALYVYDPAAAREILIAGGPGRKLTPASDGRTVVWVQATPAGQAIMAYDLKTGHSRTLLAAAPANEFGGLAVAGQTLFYKNAAPGRNGLFALNMSSGQERLVSLAGQNPLAGERALVWTEAAYAGERQPARWRLLARPLNPDGQPVGPPVEIASSSGQIEASLEGREIVWSALPPAPAPDQQPHIYNLDRGQGQTVAARPARKPLVKGSKVAWIEPPDRGGGWAAYLLDTATRRQTALVKISSAKVRLNGFAGPAALALTVNRDTRSETGELYLASLDQPALSFPAATAPAVTTAANPLNCGQVFRQGYHLFDCNGRWDVDGVQFILPERGINGQSFWDANYKASNTSGQVDYWLDQATQGLGARTLRVFVDMPNTSYPGPTSPATVYDFAIKAANRGMRLGLVLHNDTSWTLTPARKQWLAELLNYFKDRSALSLIAYLNADNEINNHCGAGADCYDNNPDYVNRANQWVADFSGYVRGLNPALLITAGMATEKPDGDGQPAVYNFFRTGGTAPALATSLDFLSPHSYGGGGYGIWPALRYNLAYQGPIVLEEYGYPTDLLAQHPYQTEGGPTCRQDPYLAECANTAPYFVEVNARAMRENTYDGFTGGSAWMLADSNRKDCASPADFYTGLLAAGEYPVCAKNGTSTRTTGALKATGARVRFHHTGTLAPPAFLLSLTPVSIIQINLTWNDNFQSETGYTIERQPAGVNQWQIIGVAGPNVTMYRDIGLQAGATYNYRVKVNPASGNPLYSNTAGAATPATAEYTVTAGTDNGLGGPGTLSAALGQATAGQTIWLNPPAGLLTVTGPQPEVPAGVTLAGRCGAGPEIILRGSSGASGLRVKGPDSLLYGLRLEGFNTAALSLGAGSRLKCVSTLK